MIDSIDDDQPEHVSKSERKRQMTALQKMGEELVALPETQLMKVPLDSGLLKAILMARSLKSHEARRRQLQYIGKLMRTVDPEPIQTALEKIQSKHQQGQAQFHQVERWRDRLIAEGDVALQVFLEQFPDADGQYLRQIVRKAQLEQSTKTATELFRYLRGLMEEH